MPKLAQMLVVDTVAATGNVSSQLLASSLWTT